MTEQAWMDAGREVIYAFLALQDSKTIGQQSQAYIALSDAVSDLSSWFPEYDYEVGMESIGQEIDV